MPSSSGICTAPADATAFAHRASRLFHVIEGLRLDGSYVRNNGLCCRVDLHHRAAAWARNFEVGVFLCHQRIISQSGLARCESNRKDVKQVEHLPSQQEHRNSDHHDRQDLTKCQATPVRLEVPCTKAENIQGREGKHQRPQNVVDLFPGGTKQDERRQYGNRGRMRDTAASLDPGIRRSQARQNVS